MKQTIHSSQYLGEHRAYWWNNDFMELMAQRWQLNKVHSCLDLGCGKGHWALLLLKHLPNDCQLTGVDFEDEWGREITKRASQNDLSKRLNFIRADVNLDLPFNDDSFDMVTCQTLLIYVIDVSKTIKEMMRVLKPGGLLAIIEPNNAVNPLVFSNLDFEMSVEDRLKILEFELYCDRGREDHKLGNSSIGDIIPCYLKKFGLNDITVYISDKALSLLPDYRSEEQQVLATQLMQWSDEQSEEECKKFFLAGGGKKDRFEDIWQLIVRGNSKIKTALNDKNYCAAGGRLMYLISARK